MNFTLASASPRRKDLLSTFIKKFEILPADIDETFCSDETPLENAIRIASQKAEHIFTFRPEACVIAADTVVAKNLVPYAKPTDFDDAFNMLKKLNGSEHEIITAVSVRSRLVKFDFFEKTVVKFRSNSDDLLRWYVSTGEPFDKAGGYGIQEKGSILIEYIRGSYDNVVGLPASVLINRIVEHNIMKLEDLVLEH